MAISDDHGMGVRMRLDLMDLGVQEGHNKRRDGVATASKRRLGLFGPKHQLASIIASIDATRIQEITESTQRYDMI